MRRFSKTVSFLAVHITAKRMRIFLYILMALLAFLMQMTPHGFPAPFGARAVLLVPITVLIAMFSGPIGGGWAGIVIGLFWDVYADRLFGLNAFLLLMIGCTCGLLLRLLLRNNLLTAILLSAASVFLHGLLDWFLNCALLQVEGTFYALMHITLPNCLYTVLLSPLLYGVFNGIENRIRKTER